jgi:hypothetical protein
VQLLTRIKCTERSQIIAKYLNHSYANVCKFTLEEHTLSSCTHLLTKYYKHRSKPLQSSRQVCWEILILKLNGYLCKSYLIHSTVRINSSPDDKGLKIEATRPNLLKAGRSVKLTSTSLRTSSLQSYHSLMISYFQGTESVDGSLHVKYTTSLHNDGISFMKVRKCYTIQWNNNATREKENFKGVVYILNYSPLNSVFTYPY